MHNIVMGNQMLNQFCNSILMQNVPNTKIMVVVLTCGLSVCLVEKQVRQLDPDYSNSSS